MPRFAMIPVARPSSSDPPSPPIQSATHPVGASSIIRPWLTLAGLTFALSLWNWALTLALAIALVAGVSIYLSQEGRLNLKWLRRSRAWRLNRSLWIALLCGSGVFAMVYGLIQVWRESNAPWLVTGLIIQGTGILAALSFLVWDRMMTRPQRIRPHGGDDVQNVGTHSVGAQTPTNTRSFHELLDELTHPDALKRFLAVRQVMAGGIQQLGVKGDETSIWTPADVYHCLQLMQQQEHDPIVRQAIQEAIAHLHHHTSIPEASVSSSSPQFSASRSVVTIPQLIRTRRKAMALPVFEDASK